MKCSPGWAILYSQLTFEDNENHFFFFFFFFFSAPAWMSTLDTLCNEVSRLKTEFERVNARFTAEAMIAKLVSSLYDFYASQDKTSRVKNKEDPCLLNKYVVMDETTKRCINLGNIENDIESLWLGRMDSFLVAKEGQTYEVSLHPSQLQNDRPLPVLYLDTGERLPIIRRAEERTHIFLQQHRPHREGLRLSDLKDSFCEFDAMSKVASFAFSSEVYLIRDHEPLSKLVGAWVRAPDPSTIRATLRVDAGKMRLFYNEMKKNPSHYVHIFCSGQTSLFIYLCLTETQELQEFNTITTQMLIGHI